MPQKTPYIPDFNIVEQCGQGGSSTVWLGVDYDGIRRAIRIIDLVRGRSREQIEAEKNAISLYRNVANRHENLLDILYIGKTNEYLYYVTELADDTGDVQSRYNPDTLAYRIYAHKLSKEEMLNCISEILDGVEQLHVNGIAHHDLKPENILFLHGRLKIGDPGLMAPILEPAHGGTTGFRPTWNDADGIAADIYAIGKIIYCLYSGMDASDFPVLPSGLKLRKVAALNRIALKCCSESPERRYKNVAQIQCDIENLRNRPTWRSRLRIANAVSTPLLILLLLALAFFHFKPKAEARMRRIPEKTALSRFHALRAAASEWNLKSTLTALQNLRECSPEINEDPEFRDYFRTLSDHLAWLGVYHPKNDMQFMLRDFLGALKSLKPSEQEENIVKRTLQMTEKDELCPSMLVLYYRIARRQGNAEKAEKILQELKNFDISGLNRVSAAICWIRLALLLTREQRFDDALLFARHAEKLAPYFYGAYVVQFQIHYLRKDYAAAADAMRRLYKIQPDNILLPNLAGLLADHAAQ